MFAFILRKAADIWSSTFRSGPISTTGHVTKLHLAYPQNEDDFVRSIYNQFPDAIDRLKNAYSVRDHESVATEDVSPSQLLFDTDYDEVNRTFVSILALRWLYKNQYDHFVLSQPKPDRLTKTSFDWISDQVERILVNGDDQEALIVSLVINDMGKDPQLAVDYYEKIGQDISNLNHDIILAKAIKANLIPCLEFLPQDSRRGVIYGKLLGSKLNLGQLVQAECPSICLSALLNIQAHKSAFGIWFLEQVLDLAGAAGHLDWRCAGKLTEPIFQAYKDGYSACIATMSGKRPLRECYDSVLQGRVQRVHEKGFRALDITHKQNRAFSRILCMGGVTDYETAEFYDECWKSLDVSITDNLTVSLNMDGSIAEPAVLPTYMPALLQYGANLSYEKKSEKVEIMCSILCFMGRVMNRSGCIQTEDGLVERSVLPVLQDVIQNDRFRTRPNILDSTDVPESVPFKFSSD